MLAQCLFVHKSSLERPNEMGTYTIPIDWPAIQLVVQAF
ncbi:hypothetical protein PNK_1048 [Candidatus Protochlamydia naegleriophila]|uniref:Uncharacterized protein n=1 Tax=Candidatus Protochlamydia naegleriophila TaxID=389348 RepID=A0A0U5J9F2_9BACT|nr:hypothetical protein PNK_1048 [Candidatus Protochlamydia naegleriophila]